MESDWIFGLEVNERPCLKGHTMSQKFWFQASTKKQWCLQNKEPYCYYCLVSKSSLTLLQNPKDPPGSVLPWEFPDKNIKKAAARSSFSKGTSIIRIKSPSPCMVVDSLPLSH